MTTHVTPESLRDLADLARRLEELKKKHKIVDCTVHYPVDDKGRGRFHLNISCSRIQGVRTWASQRSTYTTEYCPVCVSAFQAQHASNPTSESISMGHSALKGGLSTLKGMKQNLQYQSGDWFSRTMRLNGHVQDALKVARALCPGDDLQYAELAQLIAESAEEFMKESLDSFGTTPTDTIALWCAAMLANGRTRPRQHTYSNDMEEKRTCVTIPGVRVVSDSTADYNFQNWLEDLEAGKSLQEATIHQLERPWEYDIHLDRFREESFLSGADFQNPRDWAKAEWPLQVHWHTRELLELWTRNTLEYLQVTGTDEVFLGVQNLNAAKNKILLEVLAKLGGTYVADKNFTYVRVPKVVANWVMTFSAKRRHKTAVYVEILPEDTTADIIEVALAFYDPGTTGVFRHFREAISASQGVMTDA